jgi:hypothetical protein
MTAWNFRKTFTPQGIEIEQDPVTGEPLRVTIDGVAFVPESAPRRDSWRGWPMLGDRRGAITMEFHARKKQTA